MLVHLAIDAVGIKHSGGATVLLDLLAAALTDDRVSKITVFSSPRSTRGFDLAISEKLGEVEQPLAERLYAYRVLWLERLLGNECRRVKADILFCTGGMGSTPRIIPHVAFVQQPLPFSHEARSRCDWRLQLRMSVIKTLMRHSCQGSRRVFVQTPTMLKAVADDFGVGTEKIDVFIPSPPCLPESHRPDPAVDMMLETPTNQRLLYVGSHSPYKNVEVAVAGMELLRATLPDAKLFLTVQRDIPLCSSNAAVGIGQLKTGSLRRVYELATVLVQPSLTETVGLPMLEAMSVGTPVLAADRPYAHDICEDAALFFDPLSPKDFAQKATRLMQNAPLRAEMSRQGQALAVRRMQNKPYERMVSRLVEVARSARAAR